MRHYGVPLSRIRYFVTLWEFAAMVVNLPQDSATIVGDDHEDAMWDLHAHLQASILDGIRWLQWSKTKDGEKNRNRPKPIPRPGVDDRQTERRQFGAEPMPLDDLNKLLGWGDGPQPIGNKKGARARDERGRFTKHHA